MNNKKLLSLIELKRNSCAERLQIKSDDDNQTLNYLINLEFGKFLETNQFCCK